MSARIVVEVVCILVGSLAALFFYQKARVSHGEKEMLERELRLYKDVAMDKEPENKCSVCLGDIRQVALQPCGHLCLCRDCAKIIASQQDRKCPICRQKIKKFQNIYPS